MTIAEALKSMNAYPVPTRTVEEICLRRGLDPCSRITSFVYKSADFGLARADMLIWLSEAPDVSQGGQSYGFTDEQRMRLRSRAQELYGFLGNGGEPDGSKNIYGYKGSRL